MFFYHLSVAERTGAHRNCRARQTLKRQKNGRVAVSDAAMLAIFDLLLFPNLSCINSKINYYWNN